MSAALRESARVLLKSFVSKQEVSGADVAADVLRVLQSEAHLLYETQTIKDLFDQDPFECFYDEPKKSLPKCIESFQQTLEVTSCHRLEKADNCCHVEAVVKCPIQATSGCGEGVASSSSLPTKKRKQTDPTADAQEEISSDFIQLHFRYERDPATAKTPTCIWYSIDLSICHGPKQNLLTIRVWADGTKPSRLPAICINDDGDEDVVMGDSDDLKLEERGIGKGAPINGGRRPDHKKSSANAKEEDRDDQKEEKGREYKEESRDRYACYLDPEGLDLFQETTNLTSLDQATAFFILMTFPFYQHEFDLVGFVLDTYFGDDDDDDDDDVCSEENDDENNGKLGDNEESRSESE